MTYRVEYNGTDIEVNSLDAAIEDAKDAIAADIGPVSGWTVEHDETINDWFVQGVLDGEPVGPTAVVSGPEPTVIADEPVAQRPPVYRSAHAAETAGDREGWSRTMIFTGGAAAEVFAKASAWLAAGPPAVDVLDVGWQAVGQSVELRIHHRDGTGQ
jgi:hypothetical protein